MALSTGLHVVITAQNGPDSKWEGPVTRCVVAPTILATPPPVARLLSYILAVLHSRPTIMEIPSPGELPKAEHFPQSTISPARALTIRVTFKRPTWLIFQLNLTASFLPIIAMLGWAGRKGLCGRPRGVLLCEKTCSSSLAFGESDKNRFLRVPLLIQLVPFQ